jgi:nucleotide-binding universal stress UspA family protein
MANVSYYGIDYPTFMGYSGYDEMAVNLDIALEMREVVEDFLETAAKHLNDENVETHLAEGDAATAILEYSKTWNADLVVMGTHSHSVFEKLLMGTVASSVLEKTEVPVFMVPIKKD